MRKGMDDLAAGTEETRVFLASGATAMVILNNGEDGSSVLRCFGSEVLFWTAKVVVGLELARV